MSSKGEFREVIRIAGLDLKGENTVVQELARIKGIGTTLASALLNKLGIPLNKRVGLLSDEEISNIENAINNIAKYFPSYLLNRRYDRVTGETTHLLGTELVLAVERDIEFEKSIGSWKGIRHQLGLKVRGQRTRTTGRLHKKSVVKKRK